MKKLVYGVIALAFVFTVSLTLNAQTDGTEKVPHTEKVVKKKECKKACDKIAKKECTGEAKKDCKTSCDKTAKKECDGKAKKDCTKK